MCGTRHTRIVFGFLVAGVLGLGVPLAVAEADENVVIWPDGAALPVTYEFVEESGDGAVFERLVLRGHDLHLGTSFPEDWVIRREAGARVSFALHHSVRPDLAITLTRFPSGRFFPDLSDATWAAYKNGLRHTYGDALEILEEPHNLARGEGAVVLGEPNRAILFRLNGSGGPELRLKFFLIHRGAPLVFTLSGPEILVGANRQMVELWLSRVAPRP